MVNMSEKCILLGASLTQEKEISKNTNDYIIACDNGLELVNRFNLKPDLLIGDFDSLDIVPTEFKTIRLNPVKDTTDIYEGIIEGKKLGYKLFYLYGCLGNRIEHTLANIQIIYSLKKEGLEGFLIENDTILRIVHNEKVALPSSLFGYISVFSISENSILSLKNLKYELSEVTINNMFPIGIDNEFIGKEAIVDVKEGYILLIYNDPCFK